MAIECNRGCGASDLSWKTINGKYKLFNHNDLLHICNDGKEATELAQQKATATILNDLGIDEPSQIPLADIKQDKADKDCDNYHAQVDMKAMAISKDPAKMFSITSTSSGIAITGDDKHCAIYLPKVAVTELLKALVDFI
jgi:hypothetical protein